MRPTARISSLVAACLVVVSACSSGAASTSGGASGPSTATTRTAAAAASSYPRYPTYPGFTVSSPVMTDGGTLPMRFTCDGAAVTPPLAWTGAPAGTVGYAVVMHTLPPDGGAHWYWVLYEIAPTVDRLDEAAMPPAAIGTNSVNGKTAYTPPCSKGPGAKAYTVTVYALSGQPDLPDPTKVSRPVLLAALDGLVLAQATMDVTYSRVGSGGPASSPPGGGAPPPGRGTSRPPAQGSPRP